MSFTLPPPIIRACLQSSDTDDPLIAGFRVYCRQSPRQSPFPSIPALQNQARSFMRAGTGKAYDLNYLGRQESLPLLPSERGSRHFSLFIQTHISVSLQSLMSRTWRIFHNTWLDRPEPLWASLSPQGSRPLVALPSPRGKHHISHPGDPNQRGVMVRKTMDESSTLNIAWRLRGDLSHSGNHKGSVDSLYTMHPLSRWC